MLAEALSLADLAGMRSYVEWAHPRLAEILGPAPVPRRANGSAQAGSTQRARPAATHATSGLLTPKEARILSLLAVGRANKEIARGLGISEGTVKIHLAAIFRALRARNRTEAVIAARALGGVERLKENQRLAQV